MVNFKIFILFFFLILSGSVLAQTPVSVGSGSYASYPPETVMDEGSYFAKSYRELSEGYPFIYMSAWKVNR